jgi:hypothetical protein
VASLTDAAVVVVMAELDDHSTLGQARDVARVIAEHGYEGLNAGQLVELRAHLFHLLHGRPDDGCTGGAA